MRGAGKDVVLGHYSDRDKGAGTNAKDSLIILIFYMMNAD